MDNVSERPNYGIPEGRRSIPENSFYARLRKQRIEHYTSLGNAIKDGTLTVAQFAEERAEYDLQQEAESGHDYLTGLLNRGGFYNTFDDKLLGFRRTLHPSSKQTQAATPGSLVLLDLDDFGLVNKAHGDIVGDALLQQLALILAESVRPEDLVARFGGEEIVIFLPGIKLEDAGLAVERIRSTLSTQAAEKVKEALPENADKLANFRQTASFGIVQFPDNLTEDYLLTPKNRVALFSEAYKGASEAMRFAKVEGKNRTALKRGNGTLEVITPPANQSV